jgi:hypothetical protein
MSVRTLLFCLWVDLLLLVKKKEDFGGLTLVDEFGATKHRIRVSTGTLRIVSNCCHTQVRSAELIGHTRSSIQQKVKKAALGFVKR